MKKYVHSCEQSAVFDVGNGEVVENDKYLKTKVQKKNAVGTERKFSCLLI